MNQIAMRLGVIADLRRNKMNIILDKYNLIEYEYLLLDELRCREKLSLEEVLDNDDINLRIIKDLLTSLEEKYYIEIKEGYIYLGSGYNKIHTNLNRDIKKLDRDFSKTIPHKEYEQVIDLLDKLIYYYED
jgi:hypothetical protein